MKFMIQLLLIGLLNIQAQSADFSQKQVLDSSHFYLFDTPPYSTKEGEEIYRKRREVWKKGKYNLEFDFYLIFRVLNEDMVPVWKKVLADNPANPILPLWYMHALTRLQNPDYLPLVTQWQYSSNSIYREYVANAYGFLGKSSHIPVLKKWYESETNDYVKETLLASIKKLSTGDSIDRIPYLPVCYTKDTSCIVFFSNAAIASVDGYHWKKEHTAFRDIEYTRNVYYPIQAFSFPLKKVVKPLFAIEFMGQYHVGQDCGWFLEGLPVHSIADGIVRSMTHESSWGNLLVIESKVAGTMITHLYGHLAEEMDVSVGDSVRAGQKIGMLGRAVSYENGGYWPHLHLGIERLPYDEARCVGYADDIGEYVSMEQLVDIFQENSTRHKESD